MEIAIGDIGRITFEDKVDLLLLAPFERFNNYVFDGALPETEIRWAKLSDPVSGLCSMYGYLATNHEVLNKPYIFIDERLKVRTLALFTELTLLHEMCHFKASRHDAAFVKELLRALQIVSWEPLVGRCVPDFQIEELKP
jgi:hypothetical protein